MKWLTWSGLDKHYDLGLLVGRVGLGLMMVAHGVPKVLDPSGWAGLGGAMSSLGITFMPEAWGAAAAIGEALGGLLVALGLFTRPAALVVCFILFVAWMMHFTGGDPFKVWSHSAETGIAFGIFVIAGGGRYAVDRYLKGG